MHRYKKICVYICIYIFILYSLCLSVHICVCRYVSLSVSVCVSLLHMRTHTCVHTSVVVSFFPLKSVSDFFHWMAEQRCSVVPHEPCTNLHELGADNALTETAAIGHDL